MAIFNGTISSAVMELDTNLVVILPYDRPAERQQTPCKVLYLLHGLSDNAQAWTRNTVIARYAQQYGYAVVMPEVNRSFYTDMEFGLKYFTYVSEELPNLCNTMFNISTKREDTFIAGLSMGGYGAIKCGLTFPEQYAGIASFSGALDVKTTIDDEMSPALKTEFISVLGPSLQLKPENDLLVLAEELTAVSASDRPKIFITCGKQDFLYDSNKTFTTQLDNHSIAYTYNEWEGEHEWGFWDTSVAMFLDFLER